MVIYIGYILVWDIKREESKYYSLDPIFIIYIIMGLILIMLVRKNISKVHSLDFSCIIEMTENEHTSWAEIASTYKITRREIEILQLVYKGKSNPDIAAQLYISESTVKHHLSNIYEKTKTTSRYELINMMFSKKLD